MLLTIMFVKKTSMSGLKAMMMNLAGYVMKILLTVTLVPINPKTICTFSHVILVIQVTCYQPTRNPALLMTLTPLLNLQLLMNVNMVSTKMNLVPASYLAVLKANGIMMAHVSITVPYVTANAQSALRCKELVQSVKLVTLLLQLACVKNLMLVAHSLTDL